MALTWRLHPKSHITFVNEGKRGQEPAVLVDQIGPHQDLHPRLERQERRRQLVTAIRSHNRPQSATILRRDTYEIR